MALRYPLPSGHPAWTFGDGYRTSIFYYIKRKSASADSPGTPFFSAMARPLSMPVAKPVHPWSKQRKSVENLRPDRQNQSAHLHPRPPGVAHRRCGPSRRQGRHVDGFLLTGQVELDEMTGPRKTGAQLTSSAASAQPQARRRLLPSCASSRGGPSAQHGLRHLPARRGKRLRSCACLHLPARPGSSGGRSVRSCGRRRTAAASKSQLVEVACELAALDPARGSKPGSNSRTRRAPRWRPRPTPEGTRFLFSASKDLLHVEALSSLN